MSPFDSTERGWVNSDAIDVDGVAIDFGDGNTIPKITCGFDVAQSRANLGAMPFGIAPIFTDQYLKSAPIVNVRPFCSANSESRRTLSMYWRLSSFVRFCASATSLSRGVS